VTGLRRGAGRSPAGWAASGATGRAVSREWVRDGVSGRLRANPAARHFLAGEVVRMPAFGSHVSDADLEALVAYVHWVRRHPRTGRAGGAGR
jgi:mono/diheme cytochrome c family protein